jgi:hypothetical protein
MMSTLRTINPTSQLTADILYASPGKRRIETDVMKMCYFSSCAALLPTHVVLDQAHVGLRGIPRQRQHARVLRPLLRPSRK